MGLIPAVLIKSTMDDIPKIVDNLAIYEGDLVRSDSLTTEMQVWRGRWLGCKDAPDSLIASLNSCSRDLFPNLHVLLQIGCLLFLLGLPVVKLRDYFQQFNDTRSPCAQQ